MAESTRDVWITGVGIVSCLGEGPDAHWQKLMKAQPSADTATFAPFIVNPLAPINFDLQIPKKGDQRQMENWQRIGTYAAGLALNSAGVKGNTDLLSHMDMIVAAGGGERDLTVDSNILSGIAHSANPAAFLNERLMSDLRPTLFLAQLSNLLAGNISIVHGVTGSSRTFMGEESAGIDAVRIAHSRIGARQSDIALVGGSYNGERPDLLMLYEFAGLALKNNFEPVWERRQWQRWFCVGVAGGFSRDRGKRSCGKTRCQTIGSPQRCGLRPCQPEAWNGYRNAVAAMGSNQGQDKYRPCRIIVRGDRRQSCNRRGATFSGAALRSCRACHRIISRSWVGAAIPHEHRAGHGRT